MNIFVTDHDPQKSAQALDDKRVIKMILESAQMLSTAMHQVGLLNAPYKVTHVNHPCSVWVRETEANYMWLLQHMQFLCIEYHNRYGKIHKCADMLHTFFSARHYMPNGPLTPFANCTPYKDVETIEAYRRTMNEKWMLDKRTPTWKKGCKPTW